MNNLEANDITARAHRRVSRIQNGLLDSLEVATVSLLQFIVQQRKMGSVSVAPDLSDHVAVTLRWQSIQPRQR